MDRVTLLPPGLKYHPNYLTQEQHDWLVKTIDQQIWMMMMRRRVQHYGYRYDYKMRFVDPSMRIPMPEWANRLSRKLMTDGMMMDDAQQIIVNEYEPGQGINQHVDCIPCFGGIVVSLSLLSPVVMDFRNIQTNEKVHVLLEPRSALVLMGEARYQWTHAIARRHVDNYYGRKIERSRRLSVTLRTVLLNKEQS